MLAERLRAHRGAVEIAAAVGVIALLPALGGYSLYGLDVATTALLYGLFVLSWDVFSGATGELSFGHSFFIGSAAFAAALSQLHLGSGAPTGILLGAAVGMGGGALIGALTLKHTGAIFAMVTMAAQLGFHRALFLWGDTFGGEEGILISRPWIDDALLRYLTVALVMLVSLVGARRFRESRWGRQLRASGGDARIALASGVPIRRARILGSAVSGLLAGLGGSLLALQMGFAHHEMAGDSLAGLVFLLAVVGGVGHLFGPWVAGLAYVALVRELLTPIGEWEPVLTFGALFLCVWFLPSGLASAGRTLARGRTGPRT